jgi:Outer membrane lipoprotein-sorting protein
MNSWIVLFVLTGALWGQDARQIVQESQNRTRSKSQRYEGTLEVISSSSKVSKKRWEFLRTGSYGDSKSVLRFLEPPEVKGVSLLVINYPDRSSDQWMWRPAIEREQRIALQDRSTRFFGTDFTFEDLEERDANQFDYRLIGEENIDGAWCWKVEARPRQNKSSQYTYSYLWIRKDNYVLGQLEGYNKKGLARRIHYSDLANVQGVWTARELEVTDPEKKSRTVLKLEKLQYNIPLKDEQFTLQALRRAS